MAWVLWKDGESKRLKQKRKPCFEITLSHIQTVWSEGTAAVSWPVASLLAQAFLMLIALYQRSTSWI